MKMVSFGPTFFFRAAGSVIVTFLESLVGSYTERHLMVLGVVLIVFVMFLPDGLIGLARRLAASRGRAAP